MDVSIMVKVYTHIPRMQNMDLCYDFSIWKQSVDGKVLLQNTILRHIVEGILNGYYISLLISQTSCQNIY